MSGTFGYKIVDHSDVAPVGTAPTTSSFSSGFNGLSKTDRYILYGTDDLYEEMIQFLKSFIT